MRRAAAALVAALLPLAPARAQDVPPHDWEAGFSLSLRDFTVDSAPWSPWLETAVSIERVLPRGLLRLEAIEGRRFDAWDAAVGVDAWNGLWERAYGNLHLQFAPGADARPAFDVTAALYQGVGRGWELGASWRRQRFERADADVDRFGLSAARYLDGWYLRAGAEVAGRSGLEGVQAAAVARWYLDPPEDLVEAGFAWGETPELAGPDEIVFGTGGLGHLRFQLFPWPYLGVGAAAEVRTFTDLPVRHGISASLRARW